MATAERDTQLFKSDYEKLKAEIHKVIVGQEPIVDGVLRAMLAGGHVLLEGVPGLGKTLLVRTLSDALTLDAGRIQFTPDLMPADVVGTNIITEDESGRRGFEFQNGPVFTNVLLADEINRATPKTQSALLEAMQEQRVTAGGSTYTLPAPFFTMATQNPLEQEGTYPLPEAQLDRFMFKLLVPFPTREELGEIMDRTTGATETSASSVIEEQRLKEMMSLVREIPIAGHVQDYIVRLVLATHPESGFAPDSVLRYVRIGSSPRGAQAMTLTAKVSALMSGRFNVAFEDVKNNAHAALRHRMILNFEGEAENISTDALVDDILGFVKTDLKVQSVS